MLYIIKRIFYIIERIQRILKITEIIKKNLYSNKEKECYI